jgi:hypothetical protein
MGAPEPMRFAAADGGGETHCASSPAPYSFPFTNSRAASTTAAAVRPKRS